MSWERAGVREASWSKLGASWSEGSELEQAGASWKRAGVRGATWSELE